MRYILYLLLFFPVIAFSQASGGVTLLDHKFDPHGQSPQGTYFSSCWGWTSPTGEEYAFLGNARGFSVYSMLGDTLREIQYVPGVLSTYAYREFKTYQHYLYVTTEGSNTEPATGVQILDLSTLPDSATLIKTFNYTSGGKNIARSHTVTESDGYLYLNGCANWSPGGMVIFSLLDDPTTPVYVGQYQPEYIHDSYVRNDTIFGAAIYSGGGLYVANAHNKANITLIKKITYTGSGTHHVWETHDGKYAMTVDEIGNTRSNLKVWDFKNPGVGPPYTPASTWEPNPVDKIHNVYGRGNYVYIANYGAGARVVDIHDPLTPVEAGSYDTDSNSTSSYEGCWGVYPYFFSGRWIGSDMQNGLWLMNFSELKPRVRPTLLTPSNLDSAGSQPVLFSWTSAAEQANDPHWYELHITGENVNKSWKISDTSMSLSDFTGFQNGQTYTWYINVSDEYTDVQSVNSGSFIYNGVSTGVKEISFTPHGIRLSQNYPNPFNPSTAIKYYVDKENLVSLKIFNLVGEELGTLVSGNQIKGNYEYIWDASAYPSGVYLYRLTIGNSTVTKRMTLMK